MYGSVRTVVWQGSVGDRRPYADQVGFAPVNCQFARQNEAARNSGEFSVIPILNESLRGRENPREPVL